MVWLVGEAFWLCSPCLTDSFVWREAVAALLHAHLELKDEAAGLSLRLRERPFQQSILAGRKSWPAARVVRLPEREERPGPQELRRPVGHEGRGGEIGAPIGVERDLRVPHRRGGGCVSRPDQLQRAPGPLLVG